MTQSRHHSTPLLVLRQLRDGQDVDSDDRNHKAEFDVIAATSFSSLGPDKRDDVFARIKNALKLGGLLLMEGYHVRQLKYGTGGPSNVGNLWLSELLEQAFTDFSSIQIIQEDRDLAEGTHHFKMSALVNFVGRK